ncbi:DUF1501 domain-containing protein [Cumulibacter manganitolerans]|uniref:DUF1501 domain-containing protein n=1 Tax=Cumulibacter manganitolerans TaxID=1884992 RepID=UPI001294B784|nr:DUF1501 domain-containing protein [Cumulibacter manganitolerans]
MDALTRRKFLKASALVGGAAALAGATALTLDDLLSEAARRPLVHDARILVVITLYGGNDGLNMLVPYADDAYYARRPELAYDPASVLPLDAELGLNPAMTGLRDLWGTGALAIVRGVGYPKPDRSHFRSMDIWQTAHPEAPVPTGWIGRWLDQTGDDPLRAVNIGAVLPPLMLGAKTNGAALTPTRPTVFTPALNDAIGRLAKPAASDTSAQRAVAGVYADTIKTELALGPIQRAYADDRAQENASSGTAGGSAGGQSELAVQLGLIAACIKAAVPTQVYAASLGGFDTHADEKGTQQKLMGALDGAVSGFLHELAGHPRGARTTVLVYSEFGRRVAANASQGTDHGTAGPVLVAGPLVDGGRFFGDSPSLTDLDAGDLKVTTDFRDVYGGLLADVLEHDPADVLGPGRTPLKLLRR